MHAMTVTAFVLLAIGLALMLYGLIYEVLDGHSEDYDSAYFRLFILGAILLAIDVVLWLIIGIAQFVAHLPLHVH